MLTDIRVLEWNDEEYVNFSYVDSDGFRITDVRGLEPVKADLRYSEHVMVPGGSYNSHTIGLRNIVIEAEIHPDWKNGRTVQDLRRHMYRVLPPGTFVRVRLYNNGVYESRVDGRIESIEPVMFTDTPTIQMSIVAATPYFRSPSENVVAGLTPEIRTINYDSETAWGLTLDIRPNRTLQWIEVQDMDEPIETRPTLRVNHTFNAGQRLRLVTNPGAKEASLRNDSDGSYIQALIGRVEVSNGWPMLKPGTNRIRVRGSQADGLSWDCIMVKRYVGF